MNVSGEAGGAATAIATAVYVLSVGALVGLVANRNLGPTFARLRDIELVVCIACILGPCLEDALVQVYDSCRAPPTYKGSPRWAVCNKTNVLAGRVVDSNRRVEVSDVRGGICALFGGVILGFLGDAPVVGLGLGRRLPTGFHCAHCEVSHIKQCAEGLYAI